MANKRCVFRTGFVHGRGKFPGLALPLQLEGRGWRGQKLTHRYEIEKGGNTGAGEPGKYRGKWLDSGFFWRLSVPCHGCRGHSEQHARTLVLGNARPSLRVLPDNRTPCKILFLICPRAPSSGAIKHSSRNNGVESHAAPCLQTSEPRTRGAGPHARVSRELGSAKKGAGKVPPARNWRRQTLVNSTSPPEHGETGSHHVPSPQRRCSLTTGMPACVLPFHHQHR